MKCPNFVDTTLVMADRQGVEIDYCPACRGVWLDRGELDKLLDKAVASSPVAPE
jgi:Zn-finger nucleic acid-binding protein